MISPETLRKMREAIEHPERPLKGSLAVINSDTYCDYCRGQGKSEDECDLSDLTGVGWVVVGMVAGGVYHLDCAYQNGWEPSEVESQNLLKWPEGPYA